MIRIKKLKNFGVIQSIEDEIKLNDLTIFMGDNSSGKSYMAMLIHTLIIMRMGYGDKNFLKAIKNKFRQSNIINFLETLVDDIVSTDNKTINIDLEKKHLEELNEIINFSINNYLIPKYLVYKIFNDNILDEIELDLSDIDKYLIKSFSISNQTDDINKNIIIKIKSLQSISEFPKFMPVEIIRNEILDYLIHYLIELPLKKIFELSNSIYFPASRTGYLQTYPILANKAIVRAYTQDNNKEYKLNIVLQEFISKLNTISRIKDNNFTKFIEDNIILGKVILSNKDNSIHYKTNDGVDIDIDFLSSTVSELIPLVAFLKKGFIIPNSLLVIEEPEAHLSFKNQKLMAHLITLFLKYNIKVLITTHSDFLITEINNLILKGSINKIKNNNVYDLSINYKKVNVYNFLLQDNSKSIIKKVKVDKEGIESDYIFDNIYKMIKEKNNLLDELENCDDC